MTARRRNLVLLVILAVLLLLIPLTRQQTARPNTEFLPDMAHSAAFGAFSANPVFADGKTLQAPVPGTIARGRMPLPYGASPEDARRAGETLRNPFTTGDATASERGAAVFGSFCTPCHGASGAGNGPVVARGFPAPPSLLAPKARGLKDGQIFHILTYGQGNMPAYATQISPEDRWKAILQVRALQNAAPGAK